MLADYNWLMSQYVREWIVLFNYSGNLFLRPRPKRWPPQKMMTNFDDRLERWEDS